MLLCARSASPRLWPGGLPGHSPPVACAGGSAPPQGGPFFPGAMLLSPRAALRPTACALVLPVV